MTVRFERDGAVVILTLDRPEVRNAFNAEMAALLADGYRRADADDSVRAVVVTGTPPAFCAGADLRRGADTFSPRPDAPFSAAAVSVRAWEVRKPVIAAVNGHAIGVGLALTFQCDLRIFAADATYGLVQPRRGVMGDAYSHWTLPRLVGPSVAADILLTGRTFDGVEAERMGVCSRSLPSADVLPAALAIAHDIATNTAPLSVAASKALLWATWHMAPDEIEQAETALHEVLMRHPDAREGVTAYLERRNPRWTGRVSTDLGPARWPAPGGPLPPAGPSTPTS